MSAKRNIRSTHWVVFTLVFLAGIGTSAVVFYGPSLIELEGGNKQNNQFERGAPSSGSTILNTESTNLGEIIARTNQAQIDSLEEMVKLGGPLERNSVLLGVLGQSDEDQVLDLWVQTKQLDPPARIQTQALIIQKLVRIKPLLALSEVQKFQPPRISYLLTTLFREWVQFDLDAAISQATTLSHDGKLAALKGILQERNDLTITESHKIGRQLGHEQFANSFIKEELSREALAEPERIWKELVAVAHDERVQIDLLTQTARIWVEQAGLGALDQIRESLENSPTKSFVSSLVLLEVARSNPNTAFEYALNLDNDPHNLSKFIVLQEWAETDPHGALDAISSVEKTKQYPLLLERLIKTWASYHPRTLLTDLDSLPNEAVESATKEAVSAIARGFPREAAEIVSAMETKIDDSLKIEAARSVFDLWSMRDMDAALDWVLNDVGTEGLRSRLLTHAMFPLMHRHRDSERALNVALKLPLGENEIGAEAVVIAQIANRDIDKAIEYMSKVRDGPTKTEAYSCVGYVLAENNMTDRALNLMHQVPDYAKEQYLAQVLGGWAKYHPKRLFESLDALPSKEIASTAAFSLLFYESKPSQLNPEQIETVKTYLSEEDAKQLE